MKYQFKEVRLYPTEFILDVWLCSNLSKLVGVFIERYGGTKEHYEEKLLEHEDFLTHISTTKESELKGTTRLVMVLSRKQPHILVHEIHHVLYRLSYLSGVELNEEAQEWGACLADYIFNELYPFSKMLTKTI